MPTWWCILVVFCALLPLLSVPSYLDCLCYLSSMPTSTLWCFQLIVQARVECPTLLFFPDFIAYLNCCKFWWLSVLTCVFLWLSVLCTWILLPTLRCFWSLYVILPIGVFSLQVTLSTLCFLAYLVFSGSWPCSLGFCYLPCVLWWLSVLSEFCLASSNAPSQSLESILLRHVSHRSSNFKRKFVIQFNDI